MADKQYANDASWLQRNITSRLGQAWDRLQHAVQNDNIKRKVQRGALSLIPVVGPALSTAQMFSGGKPYNKSRQQYLAQNYGNTGVREMNALRYAPWAKDSKEIQNKYYVPLQFLNSRGGIKPQFKKQYLKRYKAWKDDAKAHGYSDDSRYWQLMSQAPWEYNRIQQGTNTEITPYLMATNKYTGIGGQIKDLNKAIANAPSYQRKKQLLAERDALFKTREQLDTYYQNLSDFDKWRIKAAKVSGALALPGAAILTAQGLPYMLTTGALQPVAKKIGRSFYKPETNISKAFSTGQISKLSDSDLQLAQRYKKQFKLPENYSQAPDAYHKAALQLMRRRERTAAQTDNVKDFLAALYPGNTVLTAGRAALKHGASQGMRRFLTNRAKKEVLRNIPNATAYLGLSQAFGSGDPQIPVEVAAANPGYQGRIQDNNSTAWNVANKATAGMLEGMANKIKDYLGVYRKPQVSAQDLALARKQLPASASTDAVIAQAQKNNYNNSVQQFRRKLTAAERQEQHPRILSEMQTLVKNIKGLQNLPQNQRAEKLKTLMDKPLSAKVAAILLDSMDDPQLQDHVSSTLASDPFVLSQLIDMSGNKKGISSDVLTGTVAKLIPSVAEKTTDNYAAGLEKAEDKFQYIKSYMPLFNKFKKLSGGQESQISNHIQEITSKVVWDQVKRNPLNLNKAMSLWAMSEGYNDLADFLGNSGAFYGSIAALGIGLPLTISLLRSLFGGGFSRQPAPQQYAQQGYQAMAYAPKGITERGLVVG